MTGSGMVTFDFLLLLLLLQLLLQLLLLSR
jgi:hypothetical protein